MQACLTIELGDGEPGSCALLPDQKLTLGRNRGNSIVLHDKHASRWHAEIVWEGGHWVLYDCDTLNGTKLNGERIQLPTILSHGQAIGIGDTVLRFTCLAQEAACTLPTLPEIARPPATHTPELDADELVPTSLQADELNALCRFMAASVEETSHHALVRRALAVIQDQTGATVAGYLSLDEEDPLPRLVLPELAQVDIQLSRQLTQRIQREGRAVWLGASNAPTMESDSLLSFKDAVCVPLRTGATPLAALHVYKVGRMFREREVRFCEVLAGYLTHRLKVLRSQRTLEAENSRLRGRGVADDELIGTSPALQQVRQHIARLAPRPNTVLIVGESGVGKELVALALHRQSLRHDGPLVPVNCASIAPSLAEAELFGHCRGSFTGGEHDRPGYFQQADEGTLFLDEIGELSLECQAKLLRVIEGKGFRPVGATADVHVDVRIVAATHRDLESLVREGRFRHDLMFRLGIPIKVPPLRDHADDVPALAEHFLRKLVQDYRRPLRLTPQALQRLGAYGWPGNVRQLRAVLENAVAMTDSTVLDADALLLAEERPATPGLPGLNLEQLEAWAIRQALAQTKGNLTQAARVLGIHPDTLRSKMRKYEIEKCA